MIRCPECGVSYGRVDRTLAAWRKAWRGSPGFNELIGPVIWFITFGVLCLVGVAGAFTSPEVWPFVAGLFAFGVLTWCVSTVRCIQRMKHTSALRLILLSHLVAMLYVIVVPTILVAGYILSLSIFVGEPLLILIALVILLLPAGGLYLTRKLEYIIAAACLREQLRSEVEG